MRSKKKTEQAGITALYCRFVGYIKWPSHHSNYKADTREGVAVEYLTDNIPAKKTSRHIACST